MKQIISILVAVVAVCMVASSAVAQLSGVDSTRMTTHMEVLSVGFQQPSWDTCQAIMSELSYDEYDWESFYRN